MRITLLGHASMVIEGEDGTAVLMDPVFQDPFERDQYSCPKREVHVEKLPRPSAIFLSHSHEDHYDLPSLRQLPRTVPFYVPQDEDLVYGLRREGFTKVKVLSPWDVFEVGPLSFVATYSLDELEVGGLVMEGGHSVWNMVDTAIAQDTCVQVLERAGGRLSAAFCSYQPLLEHAAVWLSEDEFPTARYERLIEVALSCQADVLIPGSSGQCTGGERSWLNRRMFPVTRERFVSDLRAVAPEQATRIINPGDCIRLGPEGLTVETSDYATTVDTDTSTIHFDPAASPPPPLTDPNLPGYDTEGLTGFVRDLVETAWLERLRESQTYRLRGPLRTLWDRRAIVQLEVALPEEILRWHIPAWSPQAQLTAGAHPSPDYTYSYIGSQLRAFIEETSSQWPSLRAMRRKKAVAGRLATLDPARLEGEDMYYVVDGEFLWNPLMILMEA